MLRNEINESEIDFSTFSVRARLLPSIHPKEFRQSRAHAVSRIRTLIRIVATRDEKKEIDENTICDS